MWTYDPTDLDPTTSTGRLNVVRFLIGDTDTQDQKLSDEEVVFALATESDNTYKAGAFLCEALVAKYSSLVDVDLDGQLAESLSQLSKQYSSLSKQLKYKANSQGGSRLAVAGGISVTESETVRANQDRPTAFYPKQHDYKVDRETSEYE